MLRFCGVDSESRDNNSGDTILFDGDIWERAKEFFLVHKDKKSVSVLDMDGNVVCIAWQDKAADQELRMLNEIMEHSGALQFEAFYSKYDCVMIQGCNELAVRLGEYLQERKIEVIRMGKYWNYLGTDTEDFVANNHNMLVVYAEGTWEHFNDPRIEATRTSSVKFDCIYQLYMENVRMGRICNSKRSQEEFIRLLKGRNVFLLGADYELGDACDVLMRYGIEIRGFLCDEKDHDGMKCLGKESVVLDEIGKMPDLALVDCRHKDSVIGLGKVDYYAYYGYKRDEIFFFLKDYMDIPESKLVNVLQDKTVVLIGDKLLCHKLRRFLIKTGKAESSIVDYEKFSKKSGEGAQVIGLIAVLEYIGKGDSKEQWWRNFHNCKRQLREKDIYNYTGYFSRFEAFIGLECSERKSTSSMLGSRGVLLGCINNFSGNIFIRECLDNHPDILSLGYDLFENNLFSYCIRLEEVGKEQLVSAFWELVEKEMGEQTKSIFPNRDLFDKTCGEYLDEIDNHLTSQELFVAFYAAYAKMRGRKMNDITECYLYWEPHNIDRNRMRILAKWFAYQNIRGFFLCGVRNSVAQRGSALNYMSREPMAVATNRELVQWICDSVRGVGGEQSISVNGWKEIEMRFEELKLHPGKVWKAFSDTLGISWSDTLLETTKWGKGHNNDKDGFSNGYDLTPVYKTYPEYISALDQLRIQICDEEFRKKHGYPYVSCLTFSREELQELFRKEFKIEEKIRFVNSEDRADYYLDKIEWMQHFIKTHYNKMLYSRIKETYCSGLEEDIILRMVKCGILGAGEKQYYEDDKSFKNEIGDMISFFNSNAQIILYGMGKNAELILSYLNDDIKSRLVYCDQKARNMQLFYLGKKVIAPEEICSIYKDYYIFVTPSFYYRDIECELLDMGIRKNQIIRNKISWHMH